jgi:hypothetical protein
MTPPINSNNILLELYNNYTYEYLHKSGITSDHDIWRRSIASALFLLLHFHLSYCYPTDNSINCIHMSSVGIA